MKKVILLALGSALLLTQCKNDKEDPFAIVADRVGKLHRDNTVSQLDSIFRADSLVRDSTRLKLGNNEKIEVFEKGGKLLLTLSPAADTLGRIGNVRIHDARYKTETGLTLASTFGEIKSKAEIRKVITSLNNLVVLLKGSDLYFTISREDLPASLRYTPDPVELVQIPDAAPVKYMMVGWD